MKVTQVREKKEEAPHAGLRHLNSPSRFPLTPQTQLLLLNAATASPLGGLDCLLVALDLPALEATHEAASLLEGPLKIARSRLTKKVDLGQVRLEGALEWNDALDEERVGVLEVEMHDGHHGDAHHLGAHHGLELTEVVRVDGGGHQFALLRGSHRCGLDVFESGHV